MPKVIRNIGASVRARLQNVSRETGQSFELILTRYALERLLYRLSTSAYADRFVLKGATHRDARCPPEASPCLRQARFLGAEQAHSAERPSPDWKVRGGRSRPNGRQHPGIAQRVRAGADTVPGRQTVESVSPRTISWSTGQFVSSLRACGASSRRAACVIGSP
jgi:hypothetical protein